MSELKYTERQRDRLEEALLLRELNYRRNYGVEVSLGWHSVNNTCHIQLIDEREQVDTTFQVPNAEAGEAFRHPYAYAWALGALSSKELVVYNYEDGA